MTESAVPSGRFAKFAAAATAKKRSNNAGKFKAFIINRAEPVKSALGALGMSKRLKFEGWPGKPGSNNVNAPR